MGCTTKRFNKTKLCSGDLRDEIEILLRALGTPGPNDTVPPLTLTLVKLVFCGTVTVSGTARFDGVNIEDRPTHIFTARYDVDIEGLETANNFIRFKGRLFRITRVKNNDEEDYFLDIHCTERGIDTQLAALA